MKTSCISHLLLFLVNYAIANTVPVWERLAPTRRHARGRRLLAPDDQCASELWTLEHELTQIVHPIDLQGHWVSSECEIHPGPKYVLRDYQFYKNGNFLIRHYEYKDDGCTSPIYGFTVNGDILHLSKSWAVPGGMDSTFALKQVTIVPYTKSAAKALTLALRDNCRLESEKPFDWPWLEEYRDYVIYSSSNEDESGDGSATPSQTDASNVDAPAEMDCLHSANFTVTQLGLLRMDEILDPNAHSSLQQSDKYFLRRLYFGKVVRDGNSTYIRPSTFQEPLIDADQVSNCKTCQRIKGSNPLSPPRLKLSEMSSQEDSGSDDHLISSSILDQLDGDWLSTRCESYQHGMYAHRRITFSTSAQTWHLRQRYYNDPLCKHASFTILADGHYSFIDDQSDNGEIPPDAERLSYKIERVKLVPESRATVHNLRRAERCGPSHKWRQGRPVDISPYGGCAPLGIAVPTVTKDIIKVKPIAEKGQNEPNRLVLFTGDYATVGSSSRHYPTSFQSPLVKCAQVTVVVSLDTPDTPQAVLPQSPNGRYAINFARWQSNTSAVAAGNCLLVALLSLHVLRRI